MAKSRKKNPLMDYDRIFELYEISRKSKSIRTIYTRLQRASNDYLKKYRNIEKPSKILDLPKADQDYFYYSVIKEDMLKGVTTSKRNRIENKLKECQRDNASKGMQVIEERNHSFEHIHSRNHFSGRNTSEKIADFMKKSEKEKKQAYEEFCKHFTSYYHTEPPTYDDFLLNPLMNVYDYKMAKLTSDIPPENIDNVVLKIVVQVLREKFNLKINYDEIELCLYKLKHLEDDNNGMSISDFEDEEFPLIFDDYYKMVTYGREDEYTEEDKIQIEKEYEDLRKRYIEYNYYSDKLARLKDFYTID